MVIHSNLDTTVMNRTVLLTIIGTRNVEYLLKKNEQSETFLLYRELVFETKEQMINSNLR